MPAIERPDLTKIPFGPRVPPHVRGKTFRFVEEFPRFPRIGEYYVSDNRLPQENEIIFVSDPGRFPRTYHKDGHRWIVEPILGPITVSLPDLRNMRLLVLSGEFGFARELWRYK